MMDRKTLLFFVKVGLFFSAIAIIVALIIQRGANHPPLRYTDIASSSFDYIDRLASRHDSRSCISFHKQGPFNWSNESDLGMKTTLGKWANESNVDAVVYFRRDKDAIWQSRAQNVRGAVDKIADELDDLLGTVLNSDHSNNRKMPIYLPENGEEYLDVVQNLCGEMHLPHQNGSASVIELGPLGCQSKGLVIDPSMFSSDESGTQDYRVTLRREIARYSYLSNVDFEKNASQSSWFVEGLIEYFADGERYEDTLSQELVDYIRKDVSLSSDSFKGQMGDAASSLFFTFYKEMFGEEALSELVQYSYTESVDSLFSSKQIPLDTLKQNWIDAMQLRLNEQNESASTIIM